MCFEPSFFILVNYRLVVVAPPSKTKQLSLTSNGQLWVFGVNLGGENMGAERRAKALILTHISN